MKKVFVLLLCIVLWGCAEKSDFKAGLDEVFASAEAERSFRKNNYSSYIDYYVPSDVYEIKADALSTCYEYGNSRLILNVNVSGIISAKYYPDNIFTDEGLFDASKLVYEKSGKYLDSEGELNDFEYRVYEYEDRYLTHFLSRDLVFYGYSDIYDLVGMSSRILMMAKAANVKDEDVVVNYSSKDVIDFEKKEVNLFETIMPVNGNINDFLLPQNDSSAE